MLRNFYVTASMPYIYYENEELQEMLKGWSITLIAIDGMAIESIEEMSEQERADAFVTRQDAAFLFKVIGSLDPGAAQNAVDDMLLELN